ncbi:MAG: extracellular solute-binding protein [Pirellulaceae bacterium]
MAAAGRVAGWLPSLRGRMPRVGGALAVACVLSGCVSRSPAMSEVVVYTALDEEFSAPVLAEFSRETSIRVLPKYDVESTKTVGLTQAILAEAGRPRCDVFWNNEILNTLRLEAAGVVEVYRTPAGDPFPEMYRSPSGAWYGFAGRARVLLVNTELVPADVRPSSIQDLGDSRWRGKTAIAKPLFGTTATHAACLFAHWGPEAARTYFQRLKANDIQVLSGNKQVARAVSAGQAAFGITDTDDAIIEVDAGHPVVIVYPDQVAEAMGTLFIPNTVCMIKGGPHPEASRRLIDFLLSPEVERHLAQAESAQIPLNPNVQVDVRVETPRTIKPMAVDFSAAAEQWEAAARFMRDEFAGG